MPFSGFTDKETFTRLPDSFFRQLLNEIDDPAEFKVTLYAIWRMEKMEGRTRYLRSQDFAADPDFMAGLGSADLAEALDKAVTRGSLIAVDTRDGKLYFLNSPRGRAAAESARQGKIKKSGRPAGTAAHQERPNIFKLYEENIGPLTPLIADTLREAEDTYPAAWIEEAFRAAVERNARNWKYIEAILRRWKEEGRHAEEQDRRDTEKDRRRYVEGKYSDHIEH